MVALACLASIDAPVLWASDVEYPFVINGRSCDPTCAYTCPPSGSNVFPNGYSCNPPDTNGNVTCPLWENIPIQSVSDTGSWPTTDLNPGCDPANPNQCDPWNFVVGPGSVIVQNINPRPIDITVTEYIGDSSDCHNYVYALGGSTANCHRTVSKATIAPGSAAAPGYTSIPFQLSHFDAGAETQAFYITLMAPTSGLSCVSTQYRGASTDYDPN